LIEYLDRHESDIAIGMNDFDVLYDLFIEIMGCKPDGDA